MRHSRFRFGRKGAAVATLAIAALALSACSAPADEPGEEPAAEERIEIALMAFAVANTYVTPMLEQAQAVADANNVELTIFDANNDPNAQLAQLQDAIASGQYDGIITQPIYGPGLVEGVEQAIAAGIKVVNVDQILGDDFTTNAVQVDGMSANVSQRPADMGFKLGEQTVEACASKNLDPCQVAYLYNIKASALDAAMREAWDSAVAGSPVEVIAEGESFFNPANALSVVQDILTAHPNLHGIVGADQSMQGSDQALTAAGKIEDVLLVGFGGSEQALAAVAEGRWFSSVMMVPASSGKLAMEAMIEAVRNGNDLGVVDPFEGLPNGWIITRDTASQFTAEWPG
ncbi:MAG TPA: sugar ABC transporter substrate-binding protein [Terrimesophilobacter sp.]|nr:sugar ABC transporter substrate-binding protein [Terrimesophilobacter sp.]HRQ00074.1 sugar ABC transporter substrate-binding protein [Terrimesophilobacter sp.]